VVEFIVEGELGLYKREGREQDLAQVGEHGGFARWDAVLGGGGEEFAEDVVDVGGGEEIAVERGGNFAAEELGFAELEFLAGVEGAEDGMSRAAQHAATAAVGELELAAFRDTCAGILVFHGNLSFEVDLSYGEKQKSKSEIGNAKCEMRNAKCEMRNAKCEMRIKSLKEDQT
jgi:hypothetical protein